MLSSRFLTAPLIHDGHRFLPEGSTLEVDGDGLIIGLHPAAVPGRTQYLNGILCPGFVNAHCHLELSHMRGLIPRGTGLIPFLQAVTRQRTGFADEQKKAARYEAYAELHCNGVVALGDIANTADTLDLRALGKMHVHTFVECIGFSETGAAARLAYAAEVQAHFMQQCSEGVLLRQSIVPHAPYSVSESLFRLINAAERGSLISIHNQESPAEDEYYRTKTGPVRELLEGFGIDDSFFQPTGRSSLQSYLPLLDDSHPVILVHNTCSSRDDIAFTQARKPEPFWCLCPGANLYIEGHLPDVPAMGTLTDRICIGTDSLASNDNLSVFAELQILKAYYPELSWEDLLRWATYGGAAALRMERFTGSFAPGKRPGILQISALDETGIVRRIA